MLTLMQGFEVRVHAFSAHLVALIPGSSGRRSQPGDNTAFRFVTMQIEVAYRFSDVGAPPEDDRERDGVADCTVVGGVIRSAEAGIS